MASGNLIRLASRLHVDGAEFISTSGRMLECSSRGLEPSCLELDVVRRRAKAVVEAVDTYERERAAERREGFLKVRVA